MRKLIYAINLTIDGCCDHTKVMGNDDVFEYYANLLRGADTSVYGRITYQLMFPYWPDVAKNHSAETKAEDEFVQAFEAISKVVVFSKTLNSAEEKNTRIVRTDLQNEILKLKQEEGKNILIGGVDIPSQLIQLDLIDEFHFFIQPIIVGEGRRLLDGVSLPEKLKLKLVESKIFNSGCVALHYVKS